MKETTHYKGHRWTEDEIKELMRMWSEEYAMKTIQRKLNHTRYAILKQVQRLRTNGIPLKGRDVGHKHGVINKAWTQGEMEYLIRRREEKANAEEIGNEIGRSVSAVQAMIQKLRKENVDIKMRGQGVRRLWDAEALRVVQTELNRV